jgi:hypothetical protein
LPEDTIVEELRRGYTVDGRLLRASMVKVARKNNEPNVENAGESTETVPEASDELEPIVFSE